MQDKINMAGIKYPDLVEMLRFQAINLSDHTVFTYLVDGESDEQSVTYAELDEQVQMIASILQSSGAANERVLLLYPPGLDYIRGFFACLYAGAVAVPTYPPDVTRLERTLPRFLSIVNDAKPTIALTVSPILMMAQEFLSQYPELSGIEWLATDEIIMEADMGPNGGDNWEKPDIDSDSLAFLQYTSGSTATPRGVMLSHGNLLHNLDSICSAFEIQEGDKGMFWLPFYHDMGLIGGILGPLYCDVMNILMSPLDFLQRPLRWLNAISRHGATISGGPNFAYDLCVRKVTAEQKEKLDLSSWKLAFNGAEPVRADTLERFSDYFAECGFRREAFYPAYGLAEATLFVSGGQRDAYPNIHTYSTEALAGGEVELAEETDGMQLVSCGSPGNNIEIAIVDPGTLSPLPVDLEGGTDIGEIWVTGKSVARGYWERDEQNQQVFEARLAGNLDKKYMRTGDLGFLMQGELYIAGRLKDLIIIDGVNHYPQDIELTVERCHPGLRPGCSAAFSVEVGERERLVVVAEIARSNKLEVIQAQGLDLQPDTINKTIREAISRQHDLRLHDVVLLIPGTVPKTSSGKIQRHLSKIGYLEESLDVWVG